MISENTKDGFEVFDFTLDMLELPNIYKNISILIPKKEVSFVEFDVETMIACEVICAAICHKINWDFLRKAIYLKTIDDISWLKNDRLKSISGSEIEAILSQYTKKERIHAEERAKMLRVFSEILYKQDMTYTAIFFTPKMKIKKYTSIINFFNQCSVFSSDPEGKKIQLLFQNLSDYPIFKELNMYYAPTIDYHLIRCFLRRGIIHPTNQYAKNFIINQDIERKESTMAGLRRVCSESIEKLCSITEIDLKTLNRIEWWIGRTICVENKPDCCLKNKDAEWLKSHFDRCPFYEHCYAAKYNKDYLYINEPTYTGKSY